jgi:hypothetical protein
MAVPFDRVIDGTIKFIDAEIIRGMNEWQELIARIAIGRVAENIDNVKTAIINNGVVRTFGIVDADGMVDIDTLAADIKREISHKGKLTVKIPMFGVMTFKPEDIDKIHYMITGGITNENNQTA